ncbi:hypothetical protein DEJ50_10430 [Streptomyces venezuelae]|uniref:Hydrogenase expression protein HypF n=1 Tax=Streptomyces venezuelae TaxID=54571 RepID=A0A5P2D2A5_STRVZ|nr:hypothetical protein [Streptomyces venezuelae]QES48168.1 hypothetical protein DEJ50_10430 [Streptomyces venezuelae]
MRGDETQRAVAPDAESRERKGPRHAAPRKSLLTKLQIPVGKTMALAAMPTAVFVGMGMAPKLALADEKDIPFAPGPCVTRSDEPTDEESKSASKSPSPSASKSPSKTPSPGTSPGATPRPGASKSPSVKPSASSSAVKPAAKEPEKQTEKQTGGAPAPAATPTPTKTVNPLDPLGVGDKIKGFFEGLDGKPAAPAPQTPAAPAPSAPSSKSTPDPREQEIRDAAKKAGVPVSELSQEVKDTATTPKDETGKKPSADGKTADDKAEDADDKDADKEKDKDKAEATKDPDGKEPFPCPTRDAEALANAELESGIPLLPDEPWYLDSSLLTLYGLDYHGIVEVKTASGKTKKVLKFTADSLDIKDLYQTVGKSGNVAHLKSRPGSTSKIRGGTVTMYTESLKGNLFGIIPIEFSPESPPPLNVPFAFFSKVKVVQAGQFGGTLTVPGLKNYIGPAE